MERIRDCVYYAVLTSEIEAFQLGMKYAVKMLLFLLVRPFQVLCKLQKLI